MKNLMTKTLKTLAALGMTMGLALGAQAAQDPVSYMTWDDTQKRLVEDSCTSYTLVTASDTEWNAGWYVVSGTVTIDKTVTCKGAVHLIVKDGAKLTVTGKDEGAGICVSGDGNSLTVYGQSGQSGELVASGNSHAAGIGGGSSSKESNGSNITIDGGIVTAKGVGGGAGIGGGGSGKGSDITINGGTVTAIGSDGEMNGGSAGIGGGCCAAGSDITINGGTVNATGGANSDLSGAGIGGGGYAAGSGITINGGDITATGGGDGAAGIGSGKNGSSASDIYVNPLMLLKADNSTPPTTVIKHASITTDIASDLAGKRYATVTPPVEYLAPVYNTPGDPTSGIKEWETLSTNIYQFVTKDTATLSAGWWVVDGTVERMSNIAVEGAVHLILKDGCSLTVQGGQYKAGIKVASADCPLAIYGQSAGTGVLIAKGGEEAAGIGGKGQGGKGTSITINGGTITATGGNGAAGIGGGKSGSGTNIRINGGTVTATAGAATIPGFSTSAIGSGEDSNTAASGIYVNPDLMLRADNNDPPTTVIANTGADLANALKDQRYATVVLPPMVEITVKSVENATAYTNTVSEATKLAGEVTYTVLSNEIVTVIYEADKNYMFPGGYRTLTTNVTASAATVTVTLPAEQQPVAAKACTNCLTFSAEEDFGIRMVKGTPKQVPTVTLEYSTDQIYWGKFNVNTDHAANADHKLYLRGTDNTCFGCAESRKYCNVFTNTSGSVATAIACSGNIETLLDHTKVAAGQHPSMNTYAFCCLFSGFAALTTPPALPATNLTKNCYYGMFSGCTSLTAAPELPATNLAQSCYQAMFNGCTSLVVNTNAPGKAWSIPAEAATSAASAQNWNKNMFKGTLGDITNTTVTCGTQYYVASVPVPIPFDVTAPAGTEAKVYTNAVNAANYVPAGGTVWSYRDAFVVYTVTEAGKYFENGQTAVTNRLDTKAMTATDAAAPTKIDTPKVFLGVVAQRYPWDGKLDVQYKAQFVPAGTPITVTVELPNGKTESETYDCQNGKNTVAFDARAAFGEVQVKGAKVKLTLEARK